MRRYLIRRVVQIVPVLLGIGLVTFLIVRLAPGDPAAMLVDTTLLSQEELARFRAELGLDAPLARAVRGHPEGHSGVGLEGVNR